MFDVSTSLIRFWDQEFDILKPHKTAKGDRRFTPKNIEQFQLIYHLVKEKGFTLNGAKLEISRRKRMEKDKQAALEKLKALRAFLVEIKTQL